MGSKNRGARLSDIIEYERWIELYEQDLNAETCTRTTRNHSRLMIRRCRGAIKLLKAGCDPVVARNYAVTGKTDITPLGCGF